MKHRSTGTVLLHVIAGEDLKTVTLSTRGIVTRGQMQGRTLKGWMMKH